MGMASNSITYCEGEPVDPAMLQRLFREEQWNDFFDLDEVAYHLQTAVHVVTAWDSDQLIGYARLEGDNRLWAEISDVLVRSDHRGQGIGTELVRRLMVRVQEIDPHYIQVTPLGDREIHLYEKFGFRVIPGYIRMEQGTEKLTEKAAKVRGKKDGINL
jgi:ribosomal protein S18 acetylase RimI-like enzyme